MEAADLYGLPLERFVPERNALAKELRRSGRPEEAEAAAGLRKPSLAAWAVNQLIRTQSRQVQELFKAGDAAQRAQADLLGGKGNGARLRDALDRERAAVQALAHVARGLLTSEGQALSPTMLERVSDTLHAAALEEEARATVSRGCLDRELRHVGLDSGGPLPSPPPAGRLRARDEPRRKAPDLSQLRQAEARARRAADRARRDLAAAQARREAAAAAAEEAKVAVADAQKRLRETEAAVRRATRDLERARGRR